MTDAGLTPPPEAPPPDDRPLGTDPATADASTTARTGGRALAWLLLIPLLAVLYPPLYNRATPELLGMPFFYWYQLAVIPVSVVCTLLVYRASRRDGGTR